jgi:uncharacterized membrane protein
MPRDQLKPRVPLLWGTAARPLAARFTDVNRVGATVALPVLLAALALVLRLYGLSDKPLWYDEIVTLNRANLPLAELVIDALKHKHYPTYFLLLAPFASADIDEWTLRFPSAVLGAVCVLLVSRLAAEMRGPRTGLGAGLLMALSPFEVQFGQEARSYTLSFPKIRSGRIRAVRENQTIIQCDVCDHLPAWNIYRRSAQVAGPA